MCNAPSTVGRRVAAKDVWQACANFGTSVRIVAPKPSGSPIAASGQGGPMGCHDDHHGEADSPSLRL